jgi:hypothetical protein
VVVVVTICAANVESYARGLCKALQTMRDHFRAEVADLLTLETNVDDSPRPAGQVDDGP